MRATFLNCTLPVYDTVLDQVTHQAFKVKSTAGLKLQQIRDDSLLRSYDIAIYPVFRLPCFIY